MSHSFGHKNSSPLQMHTILIMFPLALSTIRTMANCTSFEETFKTNRWHMPRTPQLPNHSKPWCNLSTNELLIGQKLRSLLPLTDYLLIPPWPYLSEFRKANDQFKGKQKKNLISVIIQERGRMMMMKYGLTQAESQ